ncbi:PHD finger protein 21B isoform X1 [Takifugu rubripes]|uniref:PHD finger protein 21B isoform X1 n=1 Tax=Takifugu rubripes TaxID=31033 RepID=UPI001145FEC2|nr:PHD finger protein 21B isoform X1 [Takifugu rubripes]
MELQGLREALKVEIQCHQDGELTRQVHDRQTRLTALSDKQNLVKTCPVGATKPLSLIKPPGQGIAISVVPTKVPVSMVTAHLNGQKVASSEPQQTLPINLQTGSRAVGAGVLPFNSRRAPELPPSQMLGTLAALPIKVPPVGSLRRLTGQAAAVLPQVRPKTQIPDSLPHSVCQELQPLSLQRATAVVTPPAGATLPGDNGTLSPHQQPSSHSEALPAQPGGAESAGPAQHASAGPGVAYAIIAAASPAPGNAEPTVSEAVKVIIIQPQAADSTDGSPTPADVSPQQTPAPTSLQKDEDPEKLAFMVALGLVTTEHLEEIQAKRQERKRRSTANPAYSGLLEPERKRVPSHYLDTSLFLTARDTEDFCWKVGHMVTWSHGHGGLGPGLTLLSSTLKVGSSFIQRLAPAQNLSPQRCSNVSFLCVQDQLEHEDHCAICKEDGELQPCHNCPRAFHPNCLHPPLKTPPRGPWYCPKCQKKVLNKENMSWPHNFIQSYVTHKTVRQEEKRRLLRRNNELKNEQVYLEEQDKKLTDTIKRCMELREHLLGEQRDTQASLDRLKALIRLIQRDSSRSP